jgi:hypothetical protein
LDALPMIMILLSCSNSILVKSYGHKSMDCKRLINMDLALGAILKSSLSRMSNYDIVDTTILTRFS